MSEREFKETGNVLVDCSNCCWNIQEGLIKSRDHHVEYWKNHLALNINISTKDYGMPIAVCADKTAPLQSDGKPRLCMKANTPQFLRRISERVSN